MCVIGTVQANDNGPISLKNTSEIKLASKTEDHSIKTYIPPKAFEHLPTLLEEIKKHLPDIKIKEYFGGLIEQESCISLTHRRCWDPSSTLSTKRELGVGLGQITKAYNADGSIRFDSLEDMARIHKAELKELTWNNVALRPDLQMRAIILMSKDNYKALYEVSDPTERLKMTDAAYNSGLKSVHKRRLTCNLTKGCNAQLWDNHVGDMTTLSNKPLYGTRSAQTINDEHVFLIFHKRMHKYKPFL